jgi:hypothetical protein
MSSLPPPEPSWADLLPEQNRNLALFLLSHGALEAALRSPRLVEVRWRETGSPMPLFPGATALDIAADEIDGAHRIFSRLAGDQHCILLRNILQCVPDYRRFLAGAFDRLALGGFLVVIVPHQFLYERKLQVPSRYERSHVRFYTPGALLAEVEEALDPCRYRIRFLADNDSGFDYRAPLGAVPAGGHDIVLCLQKLAPAPWREAMEKDESQSAAYTVPHQFLPPYSEGGQDHAYRVIAPDKREIRHLIVLKLDHRGDFLMAVPAFRILRQAFSAAAITLVCGSWNQGEAHSLELFDRVVAFDFFAEDASAGAASRTTAELCAQFAELMADEPCDVAVDLRLYGETRGLLKVIDARYKAGFDPHDEYPWLTIPLNLLIPTVGGRAEQGVILANQFGTLDGEHLAFAVTFRAGLAVPEGHFLTCGPYITLAPGHYEFEVLIEPHSEGFELCYDLAADSGRRVLGAGVIRVEKARFPQFTLDSPERVKQFEFRLKARSSAPSPPFRFMGLRYRRQGVYVGVHQREAMVLLAHLVALRLEHPYGVHLVE